MSKSSKAFNAWRSRMSLTQGEAAKKLRIGRSTVINYDLGYRSDTNVEVEVPYVVLLACRALEAGLSPVI